MRSRMRKMGFFIKYSFGEYFAKGLYDLTFKWYHPKVPAGASNLYTLLNNDIKETSDKIA